MTEFIITQPVATGATTTGALDGFRSECSCGLAIQSSLRTMVEADIREHGRWHEARGDEYAIARRRRAADVVMRRVESEGEYHVICFQHGIVARVQWPAEGEAIGRAHRAVDVSVYGA